MNNYNCDVAIVGRGPVGAAMALALEGAGLSVRLVGRNAPAAPPSGPDDWDARVYALSPASQRLLARLRAWDAMDAARIAPIHDMAVHAGNAHDVRPLQFDAYAADLEALAWIVEHRNLAGALSQVLRFRDIAVDDADVTGLTIDDAAAELVLSDGRHLRARLVIGADGAHSTVRAAADLDGDRRDYEHVAVVANFEGELPHLDTARQWFSDEGIVAQLPLPPVLGADGRRRSRASLVWSAPPSLADELCALPPEGLARRVADAWAGTLGTLRVLTPARTFPLARMQARRLAAPRVALVGDAAHLVHPMAGQGMNLGFGDVEALAAVLRAREPGRDPGEPWLLRRYARARAEPVASMAVLTEGLFRLFYDPPGPLAAVPAPVLASVRELGFRAVDSLSPLKRWFARQAAR